MDEARHMTPDEFRRSGHAIIERIARYMEEVERYPVLSQVEPGSVRAKLPDAAPKQGEPFADVLRDVDEIVVPGLTHWQSPNFYAYFPANGVGPLDPRRPAFRRVRGAGHVVGDEPRMHRA